MPRWYDISAPIRDGVPGFPGDPAVRVEPVRSVEKGDPYSVSAVRLSSHTGTHVDPPRHFLPGGLGVDQVELERWNGACLVLDLTRAKGDLGGTELRASERGPERLLLKTANSARWENSDDFFGDYVGVTADGAAALLERGVRLVGIDSLSVERDPTGTFPVHHRLLAGGCLILEGLRLAGVPAGEYELRCLPLRIADGDGAPARAILVGR